MHPYILEFLCFAFLTTRCLAQESGQFQWLFSDTALASVVPTCKSLPIVVKPLNGTGIPPYYMIAFAVGDGGTAITSAIGSDENNLSWTVTHPAGSKLLLSVVDGVGNGGGIPPYFVNVMPGQTTNCVVEPPSKPAFTIQANVTGELNTCAAWRVSVKGGVPPYNVTLAELNQPVVTNVTIPNGLDAITYINRALPGNPLIVAVSDFNGNWATNIPYVNAVGSSDTNCTGLSTTFGNATLLQQEQDAVDATAKNAKRGRTTAIAASLTLTFLLLIGLGAFGAFYLRKRKREAEEELAEVKPEQFIPSMDESRVPSMNNYLDATSAYIQNRKGGSAFNNTSSPTSTAKTIIGPDLISNGSAGDGRLRRTDSQLSHPGFVNFPSTSIRRSAKAMEAASSPSQSTSSSLDSGNPFHDPEDAPPPYAARTRLSRPDP